MTSASNPWQPVTASIESAITSRDTSEYFIPSVPIEIPSEMVMVLKITGLPLAIAAPSAALSANLSMCMLQGVTMLQVDAIPTWGFLKSASSNPTARSIERLGARSTPSTTNEEYWRIPGFFGADFFEADFLVAIVKGRFLLAEDAVG